MATATHLKREFNQLLRNWLRHVGVTTAKLPPTRAVALLLIALRTMAREGRSAESIAPLARAMARNGGAGIVFDKLPPADLRALGDIRRFLDRLELYSQFLDEPEALGDIARRLAALGVDSGQAFALRHGLGAARFIIIESIRRPPEKRTGFARWGVSHPRELAELDADGDYHYLAGPMEVFVDAIRAAKEVAAEEPEPVPASQWDDQEEDFDPDYDDQPDAEETDEPESDDERQRRVDDEIRGWIEEERQEGPPGE